MNPLRLVLPFASVALVGAVWAQPSPYVLESPDPVPLGRYGLAIAVVSDLDGDGRDELVVGAPGEARAYVLKGGTDDVLHTLSVPGAVSFGSAVAEAGDVDGDGVSDLIVGAWFAADSGRAYLMSGATGELLRELVSPNAESRGQFGVAVAGVGDLDGDGRADVLVGANWENPEDAPRNAGRAYVFSGATGEALYELKPPDEQEGGLFGFSLVGAGDVSGDGVPDFYVAALNYDADNNSHGRVYLFDGASGMHLRTYASPDTTSPDDGFGDVQVAGDVDGDGIPDVIVGASGETVGRANSAGRAYVFSGATGTLLHTFESPNAHYAGLFGFAVDGAGDVDGDGTPDLLVGAWKETVNGMVDAGRAYVFSGETGAVLSVLVSPGVEVGGHFSTDVAGGTDLNGDAVPDLIVGTLEDPEDISAAGRVYVFSGAATVAAEPAPGTSSPLALTIAGPNPFRGLTRLRLELDAPAPVRLGLYDALGREVAVLLNGPFAARALEVAVAGTGLTPGVYFARAVSEGRTAVARLVLTR